MTSYHVEIKELAPMRVASFWAYGAEPELEAMGRLVAWAQPLGLLSDLSAHRVYGFNHPNPSPATPNYGYEYWIQVGDDVQPKEGMRLHDFAGGTYAVLRVKGSPGDVMGPGWSALVAWVENSEYAIGNGVCLERHVAFMDLDLDEWEFELCLSVHR